MTDQTEEAASELLAGLVPASASPAPGQNILPGNARCDVGETPLWRAHEGAATLFVHGWADTHRVWRQFAQDFIANARPTLLMDLPAHGASTSKDFGRYQAGSAIYNVCKTHAPIDAIIAHSFGTVATAKAIQLGAKADYLVLIAPPVLGWADIQRRRGADPAAIDRALELAGEKRIAEMEPYNIAEALSGYEGRVLFIGSDADPVCPADAIEEMSSKIPNAEMRSVPGLSHRDLCLSPAVLAEILQFLRYT